MSSAHYEPPQDHEPMQHHTDELLTASFSCLLPAPAEPEVIDLSQAEILSSEVEEERLKLSNHLSGYQSLQNTFYSFRHGRSEANVAQIHSGDQVIGANRYDVVPEGVERIQEQAQYLRDSLGVDSSAVIVCSNFLRARTTATLVAEVLGVTQIFVDERLGERSAGDYEGKSIPMKEKVELFKQLVEHDTSNPFERLAKIESVGEIMERTTAAVREIDSHFSGKTIILVSHHDALQILHAAAGGAHPGAYHSRPRKPNAAIELLALDAS